MNNTDTFIKNQTFKQELFESALSLQKNNFNDKAIRILNSLLTINPDNEKYLLALSNSYFITNKYSESIYFLKLAYAYNNSPFIAYFIAENCYKINKKKAIKYYKLAKNQIYKKKSLNKDESILLTKLSIIIDSYK